MTLVWVFKNSFTLYTTVEIVYITRSPLFCHLLFFWLIFILFSSTDLVLKYNRNIQWIFYFFTSVQIFNTGCFVSIANHFGAPVVGITSTSLYPWFGGMVGDVVMPSYVPVNLLPFTSRMMFAERMINSVILIAMKTYYHFKYEPAVRMLYWWYIWCYVQTLWWYCYDIFTRL